MTERARPLLEGLALTRGSLRLLAMRCVLLAVSALPAALTAFSGVAGDAALKPYYTEVGGRLPFVPFLSLFGTVFPLLGGMIAAGALLALLADQFVTAGALVLLAPRSDRDRSAGRSGQSRVLEDPSRTADHDHGLDGDRSADAVLQTRPPDGVERPSLAEDSSRTRVMAVCRREGFTHLGAFLRIVVLAVVLSGIGIVAIRAIFRALDAAGERGGWTGATRVLTLPFLSTVSILLWMASVGAWVFWTRVLTVADHRRRVRRTALLSLRLLGRHPLRAWAFFVTTTLVSILAGGAVIVAWLQAEPKGAAMLLWVALWLSALALQAFVWHWLIRSGNLLCESATVARLRGQPDDPLGLAPWRRWRKRKPPAADRIPESA